MPSEKNVAIILFQLGGPDTQAAVEPFLYNLFSDPDIINFPGSFLARKPLAKLISTLRSKTFRQKYAQIGGGSPIRRLTEQQARALEAALRPHINARAVVAMRYWHPDTREAIAALESLPFDELVLLPLYPQYSFATTRSSLNEWNRLCKPQVPVHVIDRFFDHPDYIAAIVEQTEATCRQHFSRARKHLEAGRPRFEASAERRDELVEALRGRHVAHPDPQVVDGAVVARRVGARLGVGVGEHRVDVRLEHPPAGAEVLPEALVRAVVLVAQRARRIPSPESAPDDHDRGAMEIGRSSLAHGNPRTVLRIKTVSAVRLWPPPETIQTVVFAALVFHRKKS